MMQSVRRVRARIAALEAKAEREQRAEARRDAASKAGFKPERAGQAAKEERALRSKPSGTEIHVGGPAGANKPSGALMARKRVQAETEEAGTDYLKAYLSYLRQRAYPKDRIDPNVGPRAVQHRDQMPAAAGIGHAAAGIGHAGVNGGGLGPKLDVSGPGGHSKPSIGLSHQWQFLGPTNLAVPYQIYYGLGPLSGRINAVAYDTVHSGTYYIAGATGGVWKTTDSGVSWAPLSDGWPELAVSSLAVDPTNTNVIYAGTGDYDGYLGVGHGIMKSTDGGVTWNKITPTGATDPQNTATGMDGFAVSAILIDPDNHNIITATLGRAVNWWGYVWRSTDGGQTWNSVLQTWAPWSGLSCSAKDGNGIRHYYATAPYDSNSQGNDDGAVVYRSDDRGATWNPLTLPNTLQGNDSEIKVAASPNSPGNLYLLEDWDQEIWMSADAGSTWNDTTNNFNSDWSQADYDKHIEVYSGKNAQGNTQDVIYVGLIDLLRSTNGGQTWNSIGGPTESDNAILHNDQHALMVNPANANEALVGCDGGIYRLAFDARGNPSYAGLNAHLGVTQFYHADFHPTDPTRMLGGTQDNATPVALGDLSNWDNEVGGDGAGCVINPLNPAIQYGTVDSYSEDQFNYGYLYRTNNNWDPNSVTYPAVYLGSDVVAFTPPLAIDPTTPSKVYAATDYFYRYHDNTNTWDSHLGGQRLATGTQDYVQCIAVAPSDGNRIYTGSSDGNVWMTTDGGNTWTAIQTGATPLPNLAITSISVSPTDPGSILVGLSGSGSPHLWLCANTLAGAALSWTSISGNGVTALPDISLNTITRDPDDPLRTFYVGTDVGVFQSLDGGATWQNATAPLGLPNVMVNELKALPGTRYLNAATYGRGIWHIRLDTEVASVTTNPTAVVGGTPVIGTVTITDPAPQGGFVVSLGTDNAQVAAPAMSSVIVLSGQTTATFPIITRMPVNPALVTVNISAGVNGITHTTPLTVQNVAAPHLNVSATFTRNANGIVAKITVTNNGASAANSVQITVGTLLNSTRGGSATGSTLPLAFGNLGAGGTATQTLTFPLTAGQTGDLATLHLAGRYQKVTTGSGSFTANQQQNLP
jgi:photosystem II stability/assembly factor-like uncharacterized protein